MALAAADFNISNASGEDEDDGLEEIQFWKLTQLCSAWVRFHAPGEDYYRQSLVAATSWEPALMRGRPDRRYNVAVAEADLTNAMMKLPKLQRDICILSRSDPREQGWTRRWSKQMLVWNGSYWTEYCDGHSIPDEGRVIHLRLADAIRTLLREAAQGMASNLGPTWLYM